MDSVTGVADASRGEVFADAATIGALWSSLPEVFELLPASFDAGPCPLLLVPDSPGAENVRLLTDAGHVYATVIGFCGTGRSLRGACSRSIRPLAVQSCVSRKV